ncbi:ANTAR domain-containing protein [Microlunatus flavus]|uniref:ANTAR domain-containing protein n=1 Tax=Microlunatus flavus TaxID=1036181 RepID=A0A1H9AB78_9ACTN|nr:ANTAR domain-containing protein [Microlunatus flavus]SEP73865.1 ANTAR domain-containing protein [Microlunatus flavus]
MDVSDVLGLVEGMSRLDDQHRVAAYAVDHVRDATGARYAEVVTAEGPGRALTVLATSDAGLTGELMRTRAETAGSSAPPDPERGLAGSVVVIEDLALASLWDEFAALAVERTPVHSAVLPYLVADERTAVVMPVSDDRPGWFTAEHEAYLRLAGGLTAQALRGLADARSLANLRSGLESRARVGTAVGVLVSRRGLSPDAAFELLRRRSMRSGEKVSVLAEQVLADGDLPDDAG